MCMYEIRKIHSNEVTEALALALEVFLQFEAPDYKPEGIDTFKRDISVRKAPNIGSSIQEMPIWSF